MNEAKFSENIGIVKGVPQRNNNNLLTSTAAAATKNTFAGNTLIPRHEKSHSNPIEMPSNASSNAGLANFDGGNKLFKGNGAYQEQNNYNNYNSNTNNIYQQLGAHNSKSINEINLAEVRSALDRRTLLTTSPATTAAQDNLNMGASAEIIFTNTTNNTNRSNENLLDIFNGNTTNGKNLNNSSSSNKFCNSPNDLYKQATTISANGALVPPPYRDPPPPRNSPLQQLNVPSTATVTQLQNSNSNSNFSSQSASPQHLGNALYSNQPISPTAVQQQQQTPESDYADYADYQQINDLVLPANTDESESIFQATQYNDLLQLIKFQREKISQQQMELSKVGHFVVVLFFSCSDQHNFDIFI